MNFRALPNETSLRFVLLVALALATAMDVADRLSWHIFLPAVERGRAQCRAAGVLLADLDACLLGITRARLVWDVAVGFAVVGLGVVAALVASVVRRRGLGSAPFVAEALGDSVRETGVAVPILYKDAGRVTSARADGIRRPYVEVGVQFIAQSRTNPGRALATLQHECAHHRLRDVVPARVAFWLPQTLVALVLLLVVLPQPASWRPTMIGTSIRALLLVALMLLVRASFLRARELAADHEVYRSGRIDEFTVVLESAPDPPAWWRRPLATHPARRWRQAALHNPAAACRLTAGDGILVGLVAATCTTVISQVVVAWFNQSPAGPAAAPVSWGLVGGALGCWVAAMVLRAAAATRFGADVSPVGFSLGLGLSVAVGGFILLGEPGEPTISFGPITWAASAVLGAAAVALVGWSWGAAQWWLNLDIAGRGPRVTEAGVVWAGLAAGATLFGWAGQVQALAWTAGDEIERFLVLYSLSDVAAEVLAAVVVAAVPLWLLRRRRRTRSAVPGWLSTTLRADPVPDGPRFRLGLRTAVIGGLGAAAAYGAALTIRAEVVSHRASWFTSVTERPMLLLAPTMVLAATMPCMALQAQASRLVAAFVPACAAVAVASLSVVLLDTAAAGRLDLPLAGHTALTLAGGSLLSGLTLSAMVLTLAGLTPRREWRGSRLTVAALPLATGLAVIFLVAGAARLQPSTVVDLNQIGWVHEQVNRSEAIARAQCRGDAVTTAGLRQARAAVDRLHEPNAVPATEDVRRAHLRRMAMWDACAAALAAALSEGRQLVTPNQRKEFLTADGSTAWLRQPSMCEQYRDIGRPDPCRPG